MSDTPISDTYRSGIFKDSTLLEQMEKLERFIATLRAELIKSKASTAQFSKACERNSRLAVRRELEMVKSERTRLRITGDNMAAQLASLPKCGCETRFCAPCKRDSEAAGSVAMWRVITK